MEFFERPVVEVAKGLIGASLVRRLPDGNTINSMLTEVEAYDGPDDLACHASKGRTARTEVMFGPLGVFYVYLIYGMHWMLNVVTGELGYPAAVLIRGTKNISGPGRITAGLQIDKSLNGKPAKKSSGLWFENRSIVIPHDRIETTPRIGVESAATGREFPTASFCESDLQLFCLNPHPARERSRLRSRLHAHWAALAHVAR